MLTDKQFESLNLKRVKNTEILRALCGATITEAEFVYNGYNEKMEYSICAAHLYITLPDGKKQIVIFDTPDIRNDHEVFFMDIADIPEEDF